MAVAEAQVAAPAQPSGKRPALTLIKGGPDSQIGAPVRIFGLVMVVAALGAAVWMFVLGGGAPAEPVAEPKKILSWKERQAQQAKPSAAAAAVVPPVGKPAAAAAKPKPAPKPKVVIDPNLPKELRAALTAHATVVVSLYSPESAVAEMARAEAQAGAKLAKVGFVALNVFKQKQIETLTAQLGVMSDPSVLVFRRPGKMAVRLDGFADSELVAQAAANAASTS